MSDTFNVNQSLSRNWEYLRSRYVGTHDPDATRWEFATQIKRDSAASAVAHLDLLTYMALCENESPARVRYHLISELAGPRPGKTKPALNAPISTTAAAATTTTTTTTAAAEPSTKRARRE